MRKRFVTTIILCILCALCAFGFSACDSEKPKEPGSDNGEQTEQPGSNDSEQTEEPVSVSGKTFVFVSIHGEYSEGASAETKTEWNEIFEGTNEAYKDNLLWIFAENGTWKQEIEEEEILHGTYTQDGSVVKFTEDHDSATVDESSELKVSGKTFTYSTVIESENGSVLLTQVQTFKLLEK